MLPQVAADEGSGGDTGPAGESAAVPDPVPDDDTLHTGRIVPIYEKTGTVTTKMQRVLVHHALAQLPDVLPDPLPAALRARHDLLDRRTAHQRGPLSARAAPPRRAERVPVAARNAG